MMNTTLLPVLNGALLAGAFALLARASGPRHGLRLHAAMLLIAPLVYVAFTLRAGAWNGLLAELGGTLAFGGVALLGLRRRSAALLALGWALHPVWDVALHTVGTGASYTPEGYVAACIGFDLLLAAAIGRGWAGLPLALRASAG